MCVKETSTSAERGPQMLQIITFLLVLALIYVIKAVVIMQSHEELAEDAAAFSWVHAENGENGPTTAWVYDEEEATAPSDSRVVSIPMRHQVA